jgi:hypothetical protein
MNHVEMTLMMGKKAVGALLTDGRWGMARKDKIRVLRAMIMIHVATGTSRVSTLENEQDREAQIF